MRHHYAPDEEVAQKFLLKMKEPRTQGKKTKSSWGVHGKNLYYFLDDHPAGVPEVKERHEGK